MVLHNYFIVSFVIIITVVVLILRCAMDFLSLEAKEIYFLIIKDFSLFIIGQLVQEEFESFTWSHWKFLNKLKYRLLTIISSRFGPAC